MRTLFITQWFDPEPGALRGLPLARWLMRRGHEVEVLTGFPNYPGGQIYEGYRQRLRQREVMDGVPVVRVPLYPSHSRNPLARVANYAGFALSASTVGLASVRAADVAFVYHPPATIGLPAMILRALRGTPYILHIADMWPESVIESGMAGGSAARRFLEQAIHGWCNLVYRHAAAITVLSPGFQRLLVERGVPEEKVHIVYNWTDEEVFRPVARDEALAGRLGIAGRFVVCYAGNLGQFQGIGTVLDAAARLRDRSDIVFLIAGTGQAETELRDRASSEQLANVIFTGRLPTAEMPAINALADVQLVHLRDLPFFAATVPSKTQVALASGRPVLMCVAGDAATIVQHAGAGLTAPPEDPEAMAAAIRQLAAETPEARAAMGERGRRYYLDHMGLDTGGHQMDQLLRRVAGGTSTVPAQGYRPMRP